MKKGNFAFKTAVEIFLIVFTVAILLSFLWKNVNPTTTKTELERKKVLLCQQYIQYDSNCNGYLDSTEGGTPEDVTKDVFSQIDDLKSVCDQLGTPEIKDCCKMFCSGD